MRLWDFVELCLIFAITPFILKFQPLMLHFFYLFIYLFLLNYYFIIYFASFYGHLKLFHSFRRMYDLQSCKDSNEPTGKVSQYGGV